MPQGSVEDDSLFLNPTNMLAHANYSLHKLGIVREPRRVASSEGLLQWNRARCWMWKRSDAVAEHISFNSVSQTLIRYIQARDAYQYRFLSQNKRDGLICKGHRRNVDVQFEQALTNSASGVKRGVVFIPFISQKNRRILREDAGDREISIVFGLLDEIGRGNAIRPGDGHFVPAQRWWNFKCYIHVGRCNKIQRRDISKC